MSKSEILARMSKTLILIGILVSSLGAHAADLAESYVQDTARILSLLEDQGIHRLACRVKETCVSVSDLKNSLSSVRVVEVESIAKPQFATRRMAFYAPSENTIYLNKSVSHPDSVKGYLGFHELLGINGVNEIDYQLTLMVVALDKKTKGQWPGSVLRTSDIKNALQGSAYTFNGANNSSSVTDSNSKMESGSGGSVTSIGGGAGDGDALLQRVLLYEYILKHGNAPSLRLVFGLSLPIEIVDSEDSQIIYVTGNDPKLPRHILVPRHLLMKTSERNPEAPNWAAEDILWYFTSLGTYGFVSKLKPEFELWIAKSKRKSFWYPKDPAQIHPQVMSKFFKPKYEQYCLSGSCRKATPWEEFLEINMQH